MQTNRILLLYISEVSGHHSATKAIEKGLKIVSPDAEVRNINAFRYVNPISEKIVNKIYMAVIKHAPLLWDYLYDNPAILKATMIFKNFVYSKNARRIKLLIDEFKPQVVLCTQAFPCGMAAFYKKKFKAPFLLVGVLTDYAPHGYWIYDNVDYYVAGSQESKESLFSKGVNKEKIRLLGIPIEPKFIQSHPREPLADKLGLDLNLPIVLVMGGGHGIGPIKHIVTILDNLDIKMQMMVVAGINQKLFMWLNLNKSHFKNKILSFSFVDNIDELMEISTLLITKPGGLTTAEALAKGLAMVIVKPIPGQEINNTEFLLKKGAAVRVNTDDELRSLVSHLLENKEKINLLKKRAKELSMANSSIDIANFVIGLCSTTSYTV